MRLVSLLSMLLLLAPAVASAADAPAVPGAGEVEETLTSGGTCAARSPPCGWIDPVLDLRFPEKLPCDAALGELPDPSTCHRLTTGDTLVLEGTMIWWWDVSEDGTYPLDPDQDIEITFTATERDPAWLPFSVDPPSFTLSNTDLAAPENYRQEEAEGSAIPRTLFWFERPVTLTLERTGGPTAEESRLADARGFTSVFVKAKSTPSGDRFRASFGIEELRFIEEPGHDAPAPVWPLLLLLPLAARRRAAR